MNTKNRPQGVKKANAKFILVVDDNPDDVIITIRHIKAAMIENEIVIAEDGQEALEYLFGAAASSKRDTLGHRCIVLLDLQMRRLDGFQLLERMRQDERTRDVPVIVLTMSSDELDVAESFRLGANDYFTKWMSASRLGEAIKRFY